MWMNVHANKTDHHRRRTHTQIHTKCNLFLSFCHSLFFASNMAKGQAITVYSKLFFLCRSFFVSSFLFAIPMFVSRVLSVFFFLTPSPPQFNVPSSRKMTRRFIYWMSSTQSLAKYCVHIFDLEQQICFV